MKCIHQLSANQNKSKVCLFMSWRVTDDQEHALLLRNFFECRIEVNSNGMVKSLLLFFHQLGIKQSKLIGQLWLITLRVVIASFCAENVDRPYNPLLRNVNLDAVCHLAVYCPLFHHLCKDVISLFMLPGQSKDISHWISAATRWIVFIITSEWQFRYAEFQ